MTLHKLAEPMMNPRPSVYRPVLSFYWMEALASVAAILMLTGIYFYTNHLFGWGMRQNLLLASGLGTTYIIGALLANPVSARLGRRATFRLVQIILLLLCAAAVLFHSPIPLMIILLTYSGVSGGQWPVLESMVSQAAGGDVLSKRLAVYNLDWSAANVLALAVSGTIIQHWPTGIFIVAGVCTLCSTLLIQFRGTEPVAAAGGHLQPETELLAMRTQALWLSRIALPSTYVVVCALNAMMPSLPIMRSIPPEWGTLLGSVWFASRCVAFGILGVTAFWHTRPKLMLLASALMLIAFLGVTLRPGDLFPEAHFSAGIDFFSMILFQIFLGAAMGIIYSGSLYFGMVLSDGSTEHGGYHEALIGVGSVLGPASAFAADTLRPGETGFGIAAVAGVIGLSVVAAFAAVALGRLKEKGRGL